MHKCRGLKTAFGGESSKKPCRNDDADDNEGGDRDKGHTYQEASKTIATIFGDKPSTKTKEIGSL
jgi:hypothetical protein